MNNPSFPYIDFQVKFVPAPPLGKQVTLLYRSRYITKNGLPRITVLKKPDKLRIILGESGVYDLEGATITLYPLNSQIESNISISLNPTVLALYLERRGFLAFHASAVEQDEKAVAFMAPSGGGKSTIAAQFLTAGWSLLTDDILPVESSVERIVAHPAQLHLRLNPDQAKALLSAAFLNNSALDSNDGKVTIPLDKTGFGQLRTQAAILSRIYILERIESESDISVEITPISPGNAVIQMIMLSFAPHLTHAIGLSGDRLQRIVTLVKKVPIRKLKYISGPGHFPKTYKAIIQDLSTEF